MNLLIPMAGRGSRFANQGIAIPKPLIPVAGRPMIAWALQSVAHVAYSRIIFVALSEHEATYGVTGLLRRIVGSRTTVVLLNDVTEGQLCTVMAARALVDTDEDLLIASSDTYVISNLGQEIAERRPDSRGIISVTDMPGDRWSFARIDETARVVEVAEKVRISDHASTGLYYFANGREFVSVAEEIIRNGEKTRGEYYVISAYQKYIQRGWRVDISLAPEMWDMGTPEALEKFEHHLAPVACRSSTSI
jgi:UDP-N-acetylglucosamine diphosphorylase / glucose-1-phosphate thymidylyltransferase / UDP-N-acetylgalactosamine diphosphorylase / glucosamine-1-phosphate N-acetyltransferase / galactosamine-1-phosphate N-acetyltransferase